MNNEVSLLKLNLDEEIIEKEELSSKRRREGSYSKKAILNLKKTEINESDKKIEKIIELEKKVRKKQKKLMKEGI